MTDIDKGIVYCCKVTNFSLNVQIMIINNCF